MVSLLSRLLIRNYSDTTNPEVRRSYGVLCGAVGIFLNICLFFGKLFAGLTSHSIAITADAMNNLSDAGSSIITLIGFRLSGRKPDPDHPFGHGRVEYIAGLMVSLLILLMGFELLKSSVEKIIHPQELTFSPIAVVILLVSIAVKCYMYYYNKSIGNKINSAAMAATATDSLSDTIATSVVLASTLISHFANISIDAWCGILVGLFICYAGYNAAKDTISPLLGQAPDPEFVKQIHDLVMAYPSVVGVHDLIVHNYGPGRIIISLHAEVPADGNILDIHDEIDRIEAELFEKLGCQTVIHMDPVKVGDETTEALKKMVYDYLNEFDIDIPMHDFRVVEGPTHTNLIFDIVTPFDCKYSDTEIVRRIRDRIQEDHPTYFAVINVDKQMV